MKHLFVLLLLALGVKAEPNKFIINGGDAEDLITYHTHIQIDRIAGVSVRIGSGVLIRTNVVLTVAQNVYGFSHWECGFGNLNVNNLNWIAVRNVIIHDDYSPSTLANNLAVMRLETDVELPAVPIEFIINEVNQPVPGIRGTIMGWGFTSGASTILPDLLQLGQQTVIDQAICDITYPHLAANNALEQHFCASNTTTFQSFCGGDQGGAFVTIILNMHFLVGIKSFVREADCAFDAPNAYIRVGWYEQWIQDSANYINMQ